MTALYARGGFEIAKARENGMAPAGPVIVVATTKYRCLPDDAHVFVDPGKSYRWDFVKGLYVVVAIDSQTRLGNLLHDLDHGPGDNAKQVDVIDVERVLGWQVIAAEPGRKLKTVKWPKHWVQKWLTLDCGPVDFGSV